MTEQKHFTRHQRLQQQPTKHVLIIQI